MLWLILICIVAVVFLVETAITVYLHIVRLCGLRSSAHHSRAYIVRRSIPTTVLVLSRCALLYATAFLSGGWVPSAFSSSS